MSVFKNNIGGTVPVPTTSTAAVTQPSILISIFKHNTIEKMVESIEQIKKTTTATVTATATQQLCISNLEKMKNIITNSTGSVQLGTPFEVKLSTIKSKCLGQIRTISKQTEPIQSSELYLKYVQLRIIIEFAFTFQRYTVRTQATPGMNVPKILEDLSTFNNSYSLSLISDLAHVKGEIISRTFNFKHNGANYSIPVFSLPTESITTLIQLLYVELKALYQQHSVKSPPTTQPQQQQAKVPVSDPLISSLESSLGKLSISSSTPPPPASTPTPLPTPMPTLVSNLKVKNLFYDIFKNQDNNVDCNLTLIRNEINRHIKLYPLFNIGLLLDLVSGQEESKLLEKIEIAKKNIRIEYPEYYGKHEIFNKFLKFKLMIEVGFLYQRNQLKSFLTSINANTQIRSTTFNGLSNSNVVVVFGEIVSRHDDPHTFRQILKDYEFQLNSTKYKVEYLKFSEIHDLSKLVQSEFIELYYLVKRSHGSKTTTSCSTTDSQLQIQPVTPQTQLPPTTTTTSTSTSNGDDDLFYNIFKSNDLGIAKLEIGKMKLLYPQYDFRILEKIVGSDELAKKVETIHIVAQGRFKVLKLKLAKDSPLVVNFITFRIISQVSFAFNRIQLRSFVDSNGIKDSNQLFADLSTQDQPLGADFVLNCSNPLQFRRISQDYSFKVNSISYTLKCLSYGNHEISNSIQKLFIKLCNWSKNGIPSTVEAKAPLVQTPTTNHHQLESLDDLKIQPAKPQLPPVVTTPTSTLGITTTTSQHHQLESLADLQIQPVKPTVAQQPTPTTSQHQLESLDDLKIQAKPMTAQSTTTNILGNDDDLFYNIFKSNKLEVAKLEIGKMKLLYPQYDFRTLEKIVDDGDLYKKVETIHVHTQTQLRALKMNLPKDNPMVLAYITFRILSQVSFYFNRVQLRSFIESNGITESTIQIFRDLSTQDQPIGADLVFNCSNPLTFRRISKDYTFKLKSGSYTLKCLHYGNHEISNSIQTLFINISNWSKNGIPPTLAAKVQPTITTPTLPVIHTPLPPTSTVVTPPISTSSTLGIATELLKGDGKDDIFLNVFKNVELNSINSEIKKMVEKYPIQFNFKPLQTLVNDGDELVRKIETFTSITKEIFEKLYGIKKGLLENQLYNCFITFRTIVEICFMYKRQQLKLFIQKNEHLFDIPKKSQMYSLLCMNDQSIRFSVIADMGNPSTYRKISQDFTFTHNSKNYRIPCLKIGDQEISKTIQSTFFKLCNWAKNGIPNSPILKPTTQQQIIPPIITSLPTIPTINPNEQLLFSIFGELFNNLLNSSNEIDTMVKFNRYDGWVLGKIKVVLASNESILNSKVSTIKFETIKDTSRLLDSKKDLKQFNDIVNTIFIIRSLIEFSNQSQRNSIKDYFNSTFKAVTASSKSSKVNAVNTKISQIYNEMNNAHHQFKITTETFIIDGLSVESINNITPKAMKFLYKDNQNELIVNAPLFTFSTPSDTISSLIQSYLYLIKSLILKYKLLNSTTSNGSSINTSGIGKPLSIITNSKIPTTTNFLLVNVFKESVDVIEIFNSINQLLKQLPQHKDVLNNIKSIIEDSKIQFNANIKSIRNRLDNQINVIPNTCQSKDLIFEKTLVLMVILEFNNIFQLYELKKKLKLIGGQYWNIIHSELAKHQKLKLELSHLIRGRYLSFACRFESTTKVNGFITFIPSFKYNKSEKLSLVTKLLFNEIHQILRKESITQKSTTPNGSNTPNTTSGGSSRRGNGGFSVGIKSKNVYIRDQVDVISMESDEIIQVFLKSSPSRISLIQANNIAMLTDEYSDHQAYKHSFIPLLTEEYRSQLETSFNEIEGVEIAQDGSIIGLDRIPMNQSITIHSLAELSDESICVTFQVKHKDRQDEINMNDLLLFKCFDDFNKPIFAMGKCSKSNELKGSEQTVDIEFLMSDATKDVIEKLYSISSVKKNNQLKKVHLLSFFKVSNCVTFHRELEALENVIKSSLLFPLILRPDIDIHNTMIARKYEMPSLIESMYTSSLNSSQLSAVTESLCINGITLIQGPPGTGKTHTIHSLISILMSINPMFKILICAPSHAAVDEVAKRVLKKQLISKHGVPYLPNMVRVGKEEYISPELNEICIFNKTQKARQYALENASIVYSTLSAAGSASVGKYFRPSIVIVDESTQSAESSTIIPLGLGARKLILVGDPLQLPPTIFSKESTSCGLNISLFERLSKVLPVTMLNVQYRMHPLISRFPSNQFYRDKLKDGENVKLYQHEFYNNHSYGPIAFFDIVDSQEERGKISVMNRLEVEMIFTLIKKLVQDHPICKEFSIGIITPYKLQRKEIEDRQKSFNQRLDITCNTVDGFQGAEKDIIIFSCVRNERIGFLSDRRRINVGITRAKYGLFIIGNKKLLKKDRTWGPYIEYIDSIKRLTSINSTGISKLKQQTIQYDLLHPDGLLTEFEHEANEEFENQIENSNSTNASDNSDDDDSDDNDEDYYTGSSNEEDDGDEGVDVVEIRKRINQEDDDDIDEEDDEDDDSNEDDETTTTTTTTIDRDSLVINESYPSIIINIINQLQKLNQSGKIDTTVIHNKKLLRDNFNTCSIRFYNYLNNVLKVSSDDHNTTSSSTVGSNGFSNISNQLNSIVSNIECKKRLVKEESFNRLKKLLLDGFATCTLDIYGSFISGLSLNDSDIDVNFTMQHKEDKSPLNQVSAFLSKSGLYKIQEKRLDAKVPIIRFKDLQSNIHFDMCSNSLMGRYNSMLLREYVNIDPRVKPLMLLVKWWSAQKDLNDASMDTFSSFCLVNMVIHFLQSLSPPVLPNLQNPSPADYDSSKIQYKSNSRVENYLIKYYDHTTMKFNSKLNTLNIGQLFYKFFLYYSTFNYKQFAISISKGIYDRSTSTLSASTSFDNGTDGTGFGNAKKLKGKFIIEDPFIEKNIAASLKPIKFKNYLLEFTLMEYQLRNNINITDLNELFKESLSLSSHSLNVPR